MRAFSALRIPFLILLSVRLAQPVALATTRVLAEGARTGCLDDPGAASTDRNIHARWAEGEEIDTLRMNLEAKIDGIYQCAGVNGEQFADFFADLSIVVAKALPDVECFDDPGVVRLICGQLHVRRSDGSGHGGPQ